jgi:hypothetical protein
VYLQTRLTRPLPTKDGGTLRTVQVTIDQLAAIDAQAELHTLTGFACAASGSASL